jgi:hypothetical protein
MRTRRRAGPRGGVSNECATACTRLHALTHCVMACNNALIAAASANRAARAHTHTLRNAPEGAVEAVLRRGVPALSKLLHKRVPQPLQERKRYLPAVRLVRHHQERCVLVCASRAGQRAPSQWAACGVCACSCLCGSMQCSTRQPGAAAARKRGKHASESGCASAGSCHARVRETTARNRCLTHCSRCAPSS